MKAIHDNNFWDINSELLVIGIFNKYHKEDKSKNKEESSRIMWAVHFALHPESKFYNLPNKYELLAKDFLKKPDFDWSKINDIMITFKESVLSDAERALTNWGEIMSMRDTSIKDLYKKAIEHADTDELVKIDKMLANTPKLFEDYKKIKKDYEEEKIHKKGKKINSLSDDNEL